MVWTKRGLIFTAPVSLGWAESHAALACVEHHDGCTRVYFSSRDRENRAQIGFFDVDLTRPETILDVGRAPVLGLGALGAFDDHGVTSSCVVPHAGATRLYYTGWMLGVTVPFYVSAGLAVRAAGERAFSRLSPAPLLERSAVDPFLTASPCVLADGGRWRMWYVSGTDWRRQGAAVQHRYHIKYAESADGLTWNRAGIVCIDYASDEEFAIGRPSVVKDADGYRMWYCYRGRAYRIGYAESGDGIHWERRDDDAGIDVSPSGWDSEMVAYPCVFDRDGVRFMLYNGNGYGRTGIGLAVYG